jgi:FRG domain-containing protein
VIEERTVESWSELQETLFEGSWNEPLGRHRSDHAFRGRERAVDDLSTSLARLGGRPVELERHLVRNFRKYAGRDNVPDDSVWNWLALGQHHGLPTRLLDWTYSPYVALHFATASVERFDRDGAVWMIDYVRVHEQLPEKLRDALDAEGANVFTTEMLAEVAPRVRDLHGLSGDGFALFVEPPSFDARIVNQYALFSLLSSPQVSLDSWLASREELWHRVVIPAELKWEVRDKLDLANVTERVLFPGLDGLTSWLKRYYLPRDG